MEHPSQRFQLLMSAIIGVSRAVGGLPLEHPLDTVRTRWQANPNNFKNMWHVVHELYTSKGMRGFYCGAIPNTARRAAKQTYRWPMMLFLPEFFRDRILSENTQQLYPHSPKILTGLTIANFEVIVINPLERLKVWLMTSPSRAGLFEFFRQHTSTGNILCELYRGLSPLWLRQNASWVTFLYADELIKTKYREWKKTKDLTYLDLIICGMGVGFINTAAIMPFDYIKTQKQKFTQNNESSLKILIGTIKNDGFARLYVGWKIYLLQYAIVAILTVNVIEKLEQKFKKSSQ